MAENTNLISTFDNNSAISQATKPFASQWEGDRDGYTKDQYAEYKCMVQVRNTSRGGQLVCGINMPLPRMVITALITEQASASEDQ